jgi:hypothetical protein
MKSGRETLFTKGLLTLVSIPWFWGLLWGAGIENPPIPLWKRGVEMARGLTLLGKGGGGEFLICLIRTLRSFVIDRYRPSAPHW